MWNSWYNHLILPLHKTMQEAACILLKIYLILFMKFFFKQHGISLYISSPTAQLFVCFVLFCFLLLLFCFLCFCLFVCFCFLTCVMLYNYIWYYHDLSTSGFVFLIVIIKRYFDKVKVLYIIAKILNSMKLYCYLLV